MFESDDFDQVLSQFDFPEVAPLNIAKTDGKVLNDKNTAPLTESQVSFSGKKIIDSLKSNYATENESDRNSLQATTLKPLTNNEIRETLVSPKHTKRKIINSHFDHNIKRKFPGPAGLLTGTLEESKDETICHMELLSQDIEFCQSNMQGELFESPLWLRLLEDVKVWNLQSIDNIKSIKQQALAGNLRRRKAQTVIAFVETVDRSAIDPLVILRDATGHIKCTLHRDAWSTFSTYIVSEYCAIVLWKPTVLTTGGAFKKHYLNITLSNIYAIYSSTVVTDEEKQLPKGYVTVSEADFTVIKTEIAPQHLSSNLADNNGFNGETTEGLEDLDSIFLDDLF